MTLINKAMRTRILFFLKKTKVMKSGKQVFAKQVKKGGPILSAKKSRSFLVMVKKRGK